MFSDYNAISFQTDHDTSLNQETTTLTICREFIYQPIVPDNAPTCLSWTELVVSTKISKAKVQKQLLNNINGTITGGLWAIMVSRRNLIFGNPLHIF